MNVNVLAGLKCPECGSLEPFRIVLTCWAEVYDEGITDTYEHEWTGESSCTCIKCSFRAKVKDFEPKRKTSGNKKGGKPRCSK